MVAVAQLGLERQVVALEVAGSNPVIHPKLRKQWSGSVKGGRPVDPPPSSADRASKPRSLDLLPLVVGHHDLELQ